ncbi:MAG TPA: Abi family protein [Parafilimonas sp.]|nr:Abi family protein [Parafilimonas sp.]
MKYSDPALTIEEQFQLLVKNNLTITSEAAVKDTLISIGYFRLNNYMKYFKTGNRFIDGTVVEDIRDLYEFDKFLRISLFDAIADIEVAVKALINNSLACKYSSHWISNAAIFKPGFYNYHQEMITDITDYCKNNPEEQFIKKYKNSFNDPQLPPSWMLMEIMSFGKISMIYENILHTEDKVAVSAQLKTHDNILTSWLHCLTYIRNLCAHHAKILDRTLTIKPIMPLRKKNRFLKDAEELDTSKIYAVLCCLCYLLQSINPVSDFKENITNLMINNPQLKPAFMGFTPDWENESIWK